MAHSHVDLQVQFAFPHQRASQLAPSPASPAWQHPQRVHWIIAVYPAEPAWSVLILSLLSWLLPKSHLNGEQHMRNPHLCLLQMPQAGKTSALGGSVRDAAQRASLPYNATYDVGVGSQELSKHITSIADLRL